MTLEEEELRLGDERARLDQRLGELADQIVAADEPAAFQQLAANVEKQLAGVAYLCEKYGDDATLTVRGLGAGPAANRDDRVADVRAARDGQGNAPGARRNVTAATGLVDAPFIEYDGEGEPDYETTPAALTADEMPATVPRYIAARVEEKTSVSAGNYQPLGERLQERASED